MTTHALTRWTSLSGAFSLCAVGVLAAMSPKQAHASSWGCQVILCLATPGSPTRYPECVPPITRLWKVLAMGGSFPTCSEGKVATGVTKLSRHSYLMRMALPKGEVRYYLFNTRNSAITRYTWDELPSFYRLSRAGKR
ncbi:hypothetical protein [Novosphingobium sp. KN65.2]|uniref:hypothetical protein n=1 Tax=Novosphingobium sp. KN65.2 TaxID=1478134 RepID=UPI0005DBD85A|nr:hypothetical protein [Novosphingobium sp. KN65.2]CDO37993.1 exported hypothetical protein [Novosphingobium sp. KN65.2]